MQGSAGARKYAGEPFLRHLILAAIEMYPHIPVVHAPGPRRVPQQSASAPSSPASPRVMMDGSLKEDGKTPATLRIQRRRTTPHVSKWRTPVGVSVEGELGCLGSLETGMAGEEDGHGAEGTLDPRPAADRPRTKPPNSCTKTKVDALAIAIGTSHGAYKFTRPPTGDSAGASAASRKSTPASPTSTW